MNQHFNCEWGTYVKELLLRAVRKQIAVIGITDYFSIEGYRQVRSYISNPQKLQAALGQDLWNDEEFRSAIANIVLLPNVELRLSTLVPTKHGEEKPRRINLHVIFSDAVDPDDIDQNFLGRLEFASEGAPGAIDEKKTLTRSNIEKTGRRLKAEHGFTESEYTVGCMNIAVNHGDVTDLLEGQRRTFRDQYVLALADEDIQRVSFDGQGHLTRKVLYQKSHFFFTANPSTRERVLTDDFEHEFGNAKACIWGSDAHSIDGLFEVDFDRYCWIKADRSFSGLLQVTNEPAARAYIGLDPPTVTSIRQRHRHYIQHLAVAKRGDSLPDQWFDGTSLTFNPELVAIIGRKGSGKSALADVIALMGQTKSHSSFFSFLNDDRFKKPDGPGRTSLASHFEAVVTWNNKDEHGPTTLDSEVTADQVERVKYLPQGYIEKLCASRDSSASKELETELNRVIFANIAPEDRSDHPDLESLIDDETSELKRRLSRLKAEVRGLNIEILQIGARITPEARRRLQQLLASKESDIKALAAAAPAPVPEPTVDPTAMRTVAAALEKLHAAKKQLSAIDEKTRVTGAKLTAAKAKLSAVAKLSQRINEVAASYQNLIRDFGSVAAGAGIDLPSVIDLRLDRSKLDSLKGSLDSEIKDLAAQLDPRGSQNLAADRADVAKRVGDAQTALDEPNRRYQVYLTERTAWEQRLAALTGDETTPGTAAFLRRQILDVDEALPKELLSLESRREATTLEIYDAVSQQAGIYRLYYGRIQEAFTERPEHAKVGLQFNVAVAADNFAERFFGMVTQSVSGTFCGVDEGRRQLNSILERHPLTSQHGVIAFVFEILRALLFDLRYEPPTPSDITRQLRKGAEQLKPLLDYLFTLEFLEPKYELLMDGRPLQELSPGERGLLLLYFYLALDKETTPLILDQPDENLDNESIKDTLVPLIRNAKQRRQIFVVTHNPNLAVVCDAEQVIYAKMVKGSNHAVSYECGAIENPTINKHIVNVLEGTPPAFRNRQRKYRSGGAISD